MKKTESHRDAPFGTSGLPPNVSSQYPTASEYPHTLVRRRGVIRASSGSSQRQRRFPELCASIERQPLRPAIARLIDAQGRELASRRLSRELANLSVEYLYRDERPTYLVSMSAAQVARAYPRKNDDRARGDSARPGRWFGSPNESPHPVANNGNPGHPSRVEVTHTGSRYSSQYTGSRYSSQ